MILAQTTQAAVDTVSAWTPAVVTTMITSIISAIVAAYATIKASTASLQSSTNATTIATNQAHQNDVNLAHSNQINQIALAPAMAPISTPSAANVPAAMVAGTLGTTNPPSSSPDFGPGELRTWSDGKTGMFYPIVSPPTKAA